MTIERPFSRPQKRGSPSTSCCCSASFMIAVPARFKYCSTPSSTSIMFPAIDKSSITTRTRPFGCFSTLMFVLLSWLCFADMLVSIFRGRLTFSSPFVNDSLIVSDSFTSPPWLSYIISILRPYEAPPAFKPDHTEPFIIARSHCTGCNALRRARKLRPRARGQAGLCGRMGQPRHQLSGFARFSTNRRHAIA
jgi:hypothetical protein